MVAVGLHEANGADERTRAERDRDAYSGILSIPHFDVADRIGAMMPLESFLQIAPLTEFVVAVSGISYETYVAVTYEETAANMNSFTDCPYWECVRTIEMEYMAATAMLSAPRGEYMAGPERYH